MIHDKANHTVDGDPTLRDEQVLEFCREGYLLLPGVVPDDVNRRTCDYLEGKIPADPSYIPAGLTRQDLDRIRASHEPSTIFLEEWFMQNVLLNPQVVGVMRSLLGPHVGLPILASHHHVQCPMPAQRWHHDADHVFGPELNFVEVFYFPQDTPVELGPTELVPGTHIMPTRRPNDEGGVFAAGPAGTIGVHHQSILHRRGVSTASGVRHMLKYNYWRTSPPQRDWITDPDFDFQGAYYGGHNQARYVAHMFYWLSGKGDDYRIIGGQAWPWSSPNQVGPSYGFNSDRGYQPDWRKDNQDGYAV